MNHDRVWDKEQEGRFLRGVYAGFDVGLLGLRWDLDLNIFRAAWQSRWRILFSIKFVRATFSRVCVNSEMHALFREQHSMVVCWGPSGINLGRILFLKRLHDIGPYFLKDCLFWQSHRRHWGFPSWFSVGPATMNLRCITNDPITRMLYG